MRSRVLCRLTVVLIGFWCVLATVEVLACSLPPSSLYEKFNVHERVFLGTIEGESITDKNTYALRVDEFFKWNAKRKTKIENIAVAFSIREQCGFDVLKKGDRVLIFMNRSDVVSTISGSRFIWRESDQSVAALNPVLDDIILLRRMLSQQSAAVVPDEETAVHLAMKAMIPVFGKEAVAKNKPYKAVFLGDKPTYEERVWHVKGTRFCEDKSKNCVGWEVLGAEIDKWSGEVTRVFSGD